MLTISINIHATKENSQWRMAITSKDKPVTGNNTAYENRFTSVT